MLSHIKNVLTVLINTVDITILDIKFWTCKSELPQGNFLSFLTQPKITRRRPFELTEIYYDLIKDEISRIEHVEYFTAVGITVMYID